MRSDTQDSDGAGSERIGVVFDCNLFLQAVGKGGNHAYGCLRLVAEGKITLFMSEDCLLEISEVLRRPIVRETFPMLTEEKADALVSWLRQSAVFLDPVPHVFDHPKDVKDEPYINLAIAAGAVFLVSWGKHIKNLGDASRPEGRSFTDRHPDVLVMDPSEFLSRYYRRN